MVRHIVLGNDEMLICKDSRMRIRDFYFPQVGQENHVELHSHNDGIWVDGQFSWLADDEWQLSLRYKDDTLVSDMVARNERLQLELHIDSAVYNKKNIYIKRFTIKNLSDRQRHVRIFANQHFHITGANVGDTTFYEPKSNSIIWYKGPRYFLINGQTATGGINDYATGIAEFMGKEGTYKDAEDGVLSKNPVEHGSVDSTIGLWTDVGPNSEAQVYYWICAGKKFLEVQRLNTYVLERTPERILRRVSLYWNEWVLKDITDSADLPEQVTKLYRRSLLIARSQIDGSGAVIAANDSDIMHFRKDTYSYMWPRDGAFVMMSMDLAGYCSITRNFFEFCKDVITEEGYLLHKYRPDKSAGSSWHPWIRCGKMQLPIQEDETAIVLHALLKHYEHKGDIEFIDKLYNPLIKKAAEFLCSFRDEKGLPLPSYDLWEESYGISTYTCSSVYGGLRAASTFARLVGYEEDSAKYARVAEEVRDALLDSLYQVQLGRFIRMIKTGFDCTVASDLTIDMSTAFGLLEFGVLEPHDKRLRETFEEAISALTCKTPIGGVARYQIDHYQADVLNKDVPGNPWFICTIWAAEYYIAIAERREDLEKAKEHLLWVAEHALPSGVLAEQIHPYSGAPLSVAPLTWSHAAYVSCYHHYITKYEELSDAD